MRRSDPRPPLPLRLAAWLLPTDAREEVLGDLLEDWERHRVGRRWLARAAWAWRQPLSALGARIRFRARRRPLRLLAKVRGAGLGVSWLDVKLGFRMLVKHPGVTLVVVFALGIGIPVSLAPHHLMDVILDTPLPFDEGDEIVGLVTWNLRESEQELATLRDFRRWRGELTAFDALGAALREPVNVIVQDGPAAPAGGAVMTAAAFEMTRVPPLLGRTLVPSDELVGSPDVVVIGYDLWRARLGGRPDVIGATIEVGGVPSTVVGVMPEGFYFPFRGQIWQPLRPGFTDPAGEPGPGLLVFGRLAEGVRVEEARAELTVVGLRMAAEAPVTYAHLRPEIVPFSALAFGTPRGAGWLQLFLVQALPYPLLLLACGNVAILLLARTAHRSSEIAVRTALGASRSRVVGQLFVETLLLACLATGVGLAALELAVARWVGPYAHYVPFWIDVGVSRELVGKALLVAICSAVVAGVVPALRATGTGVSRGLRSAGAGASGVRFGKTSAALIVGEVALGVGCLFATGMGYRIFHPADGSQGAVIEADRFLSAAITIPGAGPGAERSEAAADAHRRRVAATQRALAGRLAAEAGVRAVATADALPARARGSAWVQVDGADPPRGSPGHGVLRSRVEAGFFAALGVPLREGRGFDDGDLPPDVGGPRSVAIVNSVFVTEVLGDRNALGRNIRFVTDPGEPPGPAYEIVGVVPRLVTDERGSEPGGDPVVYLPALPGEFHPVALTIEVAGDPASFTSRLREIVADVDPTALVQDPVPLDELVDSEVLLIRWTVVFVGILGIVATVLSTAGLYALMSFTVARRTREIGIRAALGGSPERIVVAVARRALTQLGLGVALGALFWVVVVIGTTDARGSEGELVQALEVWPAVLTLTTGAVVVVGVVACLVPTLRGLRIRPMDALRADG